MAEDVNDKDQNGVFIRVTNRDVYTEVVHTKDAVAALRQDMQNLMTEKLQLERTVQANSSRIEKLETRFNGIVVGLGTGIVVGLIAIFRGVIG